MQVQTFINSQKRFRTLPPWANYGDVYHILEKEYHAFVALNWIKASLYLIERILTNIGFFHFLKIFAN